MEENLEKNISILKKKGTAHKLSNFCSWPEKHIVNYGFLYNPAKSQKYQKFHLDYSFTSSTIFIPLTKVSSQNGKKMKKKIQLFNLTDNSQNSTSDEYFLTFFLQPPSSSPTQSQKLTLTIFFFTMMKNKF